MEAGNQSTDASLALVSGRDAWRLPWRNDTGETVGRSHPSRHRHPASVAVCFAGGGVDGSAPPGPLLIRLVVAHFIAPPTIHGEVGTGSSVQEHYRRTPTSGQGALESLALVSRECRERAAYAGLVLWPAVAKNNPGKPAVSLLGCGTASAGRLEDRSSPLGDLHTVRMCAFRYEAMRWKTRTGDSASTGGLPPTGRWIEPTRRTGSVRKREAR